MTEFIAELPSIGVLACVTALLALSIFAALSAGVFSVASIPIAGLAGFVTADLINHGWPDVLMLLVGAVVGGLAAWLMSYPLLRLSGHRIALATIGLLLIFNIVIADIVVRGGSGGIALIQTMPNWYLFGALLIVAWFFFRMRRSRFGLAVEAVRADSPVAAVAGLNPISIQRIAIIQSGFLAGLGGVLYANNVQFLSPDTYSVDLLFVVLASVVLGGRLVWLGSIVGAFVFTALPFVLTQFMAQGGAIANGVALLAIICFVPGGLVEPGRRERRRAARAAAMLAAEPDPIGVLAADPPGQGLPTRIAGPPHVVVPPAEPAAADGGPPADGPTPVGRPSAPEAGLTTDSAQAPAIECRDVNLHFGGIVVLDHVSFAIPAGSIFGIVGPNGAGKSSLLNVMSGLQQPGSGTVLADGRVITALPAYQRARLGIARTFQEVRLFQGMTVLETIMVGEHLHRTSHLWEAMLALPREGRDRRRAEQRARALMERVGVIGRPGQFAGELSYANQRRVEIARALAAEPQVLLVDEPTAGMHKEGARSVGALLQDLRGQGLTVVLIEHNLALVLDCCDRIAVMNSGQVISEGPPREALGSPQVIEAYFGRRSDAERIESLIQLRQY
jgi:branched-chain amino acid transport system permease protein